MDGLVAALAALGLEPGADRTAVRRAFRELARVTHPDHGGDAAAFARVRAAFDVARPLVPAAAPVRTAADPYRGFLAGLDRAARMTVAPVAPRRAVAAPVAPPASATRFAAVLAGALAAA